MGSAANRKGLGMIAGAAIILAALVASVAGSVSGRPSPPRGLAAKVRRTVPPETLTSLVWTGRHLRVGVASDRVGWEAKLAAVAPRAPLEVVVEHVPTLSSLKRLAGRVERTARELDAPLTTVGVDERAHVVDVGLDPHGSPASKELARRFADQPVRFHAEPLDAPA